MSITLPKRQQGDFNYGAMTLISNAAGVIGWGNNTTGALAIGTRASTSVPIQEASFDPNTTMPPSGSSITDWTFTNANLYVVFNNGWVYSGGDNTYGQLGHGDTTARPFLKRIEYFISNSITVSNVWAAGSVSNTNGGGCVYFQTSSGVYACGANAAGNLGNASTPTSNVSTPAPCAGVNESITDVQVSAVSGNFSTFLLGSDKTVLVAGYNGQGQLGVGSTNNVTGSFTHALNASGSNISNVTKVSTTGGGGGAGSALILDSSGNVWTTGNNNNGQLGQGNTNNLNKFTQISSLTSISQAGIGGGQNGYAYALNSSGTLYAWGYNGQNNLFQNNSTNPITNPTTTVLAAGLVNSIFFPRDEQLGSNAQLFAVISSNTQIIYAGVGNGQNGVASVAHPGAFYYLPMPPLSYLGEVINAVFVHGTSNTQRLFILTSGGNLFTFGSNVDSVCTAGFCSNNQPASVYGYDIAANVPAIPLP